MKKQDILKYTDFFSYYLYQQISFLILKYIKNTKITPNQITFLALMFGIFCAIFIFFDLKILAFFMLQFSFVFDCLDGQLARYKKQSSKIGMWFDNLVDRIVENIVIISILFKNFSNIFLIKIGILLIFLNMFYSYISDLEVYTNSKYKKLTKKEKILFMPVYLLNRSFVMMILSISIFIPNLLVFLFILYIIGIVFRIYRKFYAQIH